MTRCAWVRYQGFLSDLPARGPGAVEYGFVGAVRKDFADRGQRLFWYEREFASLFSSLVSVLDRSVLVLEGYSFMSRKSQAHSIGEHGAIVRMAALRAGFEVLELPPKSLKLLAAGNGNASKSILLREVHKRWGYDAEDDDHCDAYTCMRAAALYVAPDLYALTKDEQRVVTKLGAIRAG